ncbi:hypothetical protein TrVFT333_008129 [Trichoderma virens FT-333]|nr:hypothetical protein TrVFT333_008129 [Trichoderma virens FT-333]
MGQALGVAIGGTIFNNQLRSNLGNNVHNAPPNVVALMEKLHQLSADDAESLQIRHALSKSFHVIWIVMCAFAGLSLQLNFLTKEYDMNQKHQLELTFLLKDMNGSTKVTVAEQSSRV